MPFMFHLASLECELGSCQNGKSWFGILYSGNPFSCFLYHFAFTLSFRGRYLSWINAKVKKSCIIASTNSMIFGYLRITGGFIYLSSQLDLSNHKWNSFGYVCKIETKRYVLRVEFEFAKVLKF